MRSVNPSDALIALHRRRSTRRFAAGHPTPVYAFMQAMGLINDHAEGCTIRNEAECARAVFRRPNAIDASEGRIAAGEDHTSPVYSPRAG
ncbi:DNA-3-methyladenine glycosylase I [Sinorhizobium sp. 7-81]|uniref:DNA-3-methyladenine glycosylase I n=1 Tax=Sinorhizobium sp. 7-81 TaxID=3049087 RepID=UPI0030144E71